MLMLGYCDRPVFLGWGSTSSMHTQL